MKQPADVTIIAAGRRVAGLSVADVGAYLKETADAPPADPLQPAPNRKAVSEMTDAEIGAAIARCVYYREKGEM